MTSSLSETTSDPAAGWRTLAVSVIGSSHICDNLPCQDVSRVATITAFEGRSTVVLVAADGAGSADCSAEGAALACATFVEVVTIYFTEGGLVSGVTPLMADDWIWIAASRLGVMATAADRPMRDYACTLLAALIDETALAAFQVGDGAIVVADGEEYRPIFWPQRGEYANMTYFLTEDDVLRRLQFTVLPHVPDEVALLTDGLQSLALIYATQGAHAPFFSPIFAPLRAIPRPEDATQVGELLSEFLASPTVTKRTDDDKTLVLATRRAAIPADLLPTSPSTVTTPTTVMTDDSTDHVSSQYTLSEPPVDAAISSNPEVVPIEPA